MSLRFTLAFRRTHPVEVEEAAGQASRSTKRLGKVYRPILAMMVLLKVLLRSLISFEGISNSNIATNTRSLPINFVGVGVQN